MLASWRKGSSIRSVIVVERLTMQPEDVAEASQFFSQFLLIEICELAEERLRVTREFFQGLVTNSFASFDQQRDDFTKLERGAFKQLVQVWI